MARYQYQSLTGPVWRAPVAESLAWLPSGALPRPRGLPSVPLALYAASFFAALVGPSYDPASLTWYPQGRHQPARIQAAPPWNDASVFGTPVYDPQELQWLPSATWPLRVVVPVRAGISVLNPLPPTVYDPRQFPWTEARSPRAPIERRVLGDVVEPFTAALYRPEGLQWKPTEWAIPARSLLRGVQTWSLLDPFPLTVAFDPKLFPWTEARAPRAPIERRVLGESIEPFFAAIYRPDGLQWSPVIGWPVRVLPAIRAGASLLNPFQVPPPFNAAHLAWLPSARPYPRQLVASRLGVVVLDPLPRPPSALALRVTDLGDYRYLVTDDGAVVAMAWDETLQRYIAWDASANHLLVWDASGHRYYVEDV